MFFYNINGNTSHFGKKFHGNCPFNAESKYIGIGGLHE